MCENRTHSFHFFCKYSYKDITKEYALQVQQHQSILRESEHRDIQKNMSVQILHIKYLFLYASR